MLSLTQIPITYMYMYDYMYVHMLYVCMYALKIASYMLFRYLDHCYQLLSSMILMMPSVSLLKGVPTSVIKADKVCMSVRVLRHLKKNWLGLCIY